MSGRKKATAISLPLSRTAKIMNSAVGVESVNSDIVALATKATEIFLMDLARGAYDQSSDEEFRSNSLEYDDIQKLVHSNPKYEFLRDTIPQRIKFSEALKLVEEANRRQEAPKEEEEEEEVENGNNDDNQMQEDTKEQNERSKVEEGEEEEESEEKYHLSPLVSM